MTAWRSAELPNLVLVPTLEFLKLCTAFLMSVAVVVRTSVASTWERQVAMSTTSEYPRATTCLAKLDGQSRFYPERP